MTFAQTFGGMVVRPYSTLQGLQKENHPARKGWGILLIVIGVYTLILGIFLVRRYPAVAPSIIPVPVDALYRYQIWYQGPLFIAVTLLTAGVIWVIARFRGLKGDFPTQFARVSFSTVTPFALTTMVIELIIAVLVLVRIVQPGEVVDWLTGDGSLFANAYQILAMAWVILLFVLTAKVSLNIRWWLAILLGFLIASIYGVPIGLIIR